MLNKVMFIGTITKSENKKTNSGLSVTEVVLAVTAKKNKTEFETMNVMVAFFGRTADDLAQVSVGSEIIMEGKVRVDTYSKDNGGTGSTLKINGYAFDVNPNSTCKVSKPVATAAAEPAKDEEIPF